MYIHNIYKSKWINLPLHVLACATPDRFVWWIWCTCHIHCVIQVFTKTRMFEKVWNTYHDMSSYYLICAANSSCTYDLLLIYLSRMCDLLSRLGISYIHAQLIYFSCMCDLLSPVYDINILIISYVWYNFIVIISYVWYNYTVLVYSYNLVCTTYYQLYTTYNLFKTSWQQYLYAYVEMTQAHRLVVNGATRNAQLFPTLNLSPINFRGLLRGPR